MTRTWKVLIADDESIIREGIRSSVPWDDLRLEVVGEAEDGEEALEMAVDKQANILLVDLSMPIMNGLALIRHLREQLPKCKIVIITGHDEFNYAYEAIKLEVDDYILKRLIRTCWEKCWRESCRSWRKRRVRRASADGFQTDR